ncbi:hypothetical protein CLAIMM_13062 [Cladophialophora immunda]|nr:hypothetical protein CLAIMM_13062 [Cladophialophora immunda]
MTLLEYLWTCSCLRTMAEDVVYIHLELQAQSRQMSLAISFRAIVVNVRESISQLQAAGSTALARLKSCIGQGVWRSKCLVQPREPTWHLKLVPIWFYAALRWRHYQQDSIDNH